jgi:Crp-like helix-turn-helix domain
MSTPAVNLEDNQLLAYLPPQELDTLRPHCKVISLETREEINQVGTRVIHIHFPITAAISLMEMQASGTTVEVAVVGKEGCAGSHVLDGLDVSPCRTIVQIGGMAFRVTVPQLRTLLPLIPVFQQTARRFGTVLFRHTVISVGCSQFHSVEQRLARWLLAHRHRTGLKKFPFTHDFLAEQLGVQRVTVTQALAALQDRALVTHGYGKLELLDIRGMQKAACECLTLASEAIEEYLSDIKNSGQE